MMTKGNLGFGCMRLPVLAGNPEKIDIETFSKMADLFIKRGFTYFDTSYVYHNGKSEAAVREAVVKRHPRDSFTIASKLPTFSINKKEQAAEIFQQQLENCGVEYFDYYLLHNVTAPRYEGCIKSCGMFEFLQEMKKAGKIRHIGFSFHDSAEVLDRVLTEHPEVEFVQIVVNYLDWNSRFIQSRKCYEIIRKHGKQVVIMETVKGGALAQVPAKAEALMKEADKGKSAASWAVRFAAGLEGVLAVLSGMSNLEQAEDNTSYMQDFKPLTPEETDMLFHIAELIQLGGPLHCADYRKYERICANGLPADGVLEAYNNCMLQANPQFTAELNYYRNVRYQHKILDDSPWLQGRAICADGTDATEKVAEAEAFLLKNMF